MKYLYYANRTAPKPEPASLPTPVMSPPTSIATVPSPSKPKPKPQGTQTPRRTYSITDDIDTAPAPASASRLPRAGWQNHRQSALLSDEANLALKELSPVRLPRVGQAPKREFSFSNLAEVYKAQEPAPVPERKQPMQAEFRDEKDAPPKPAPIGKTSKYQQHVDLFDDSPVEDNAPKVSKASQHYVLQNEIIFHDADTTPKAKQKASIGGGTGGRLLDETIFLQDEEDPNRIQPKKSPITRRDQQTHFSFAAEDSSTPVKPKHMAPQHFSIEGTPDPMEAEYRARALQRKEVNHFRPDTIPHFEFGEGSDDEYTPKKENSEQMNKLLKGMGKSWMMGVDSPTVSREHHYRESQLPKKDLTAHFSFGPNKEGDGEEEEKENGRNKQTKR